MEAIKAFINLIIKYSICYESFLDELQLISASGLISLWQTDGFHFTWESSSVLVEESESPVFGLSVWDFMYPLNKNGLTLATEMQNNVLM